MRRLVALLLALGVLGLSGCGMKMPRDVADPNNIYKYGIAKTPTHFYAVCTEYGENFEEDKLDWWETLYRVPLDNIALQEEIPLPKEYKGFRRRFVSIDGITAQWLFVSCEFVKENGKSTGDSFDHQYENYCISLKTGKIKTLREDIGFYVASSNSMLYVHRESKGSSIQFVGYSGIVTSPFDEEDDGGENFQLEAMRLDTGERTIIYNGKADHWNSMSMTDDGLLYLTIQGRKWFDLDTFERLTTPDIYLIIDQYNRVVPMSREQLRLPYNCKEVQQIRCGNEVLALSYQHDGEDGMELQLFDIDGTVIKTILRLYAVNSNAYGLMCFDISNAADNLIMLVEYIGEYDFEGSLYALYDTNTGAIFSSE